MTTRYEIASGLDEFSMPTKDCVRLSNRGDLYELLSSESFPLYCQETTLIIIKQYSFASKLLTKNMILQLHVFDYPGP